MLHQSHVESTVCYLIPCWGNASETKFMTRKNTKQNSILDIKNIKKIKQCKLIYKIIQGTLKNMTFPLIKV